jgi:hypothetical protein
MLGSISESQRLQILHDIVKLESKLFSIQLPASGSIYYARDLELDTPRMGIPEMDGQFCVGPYAGLRWWFGKRENLEIDRGPRKYQLRLCCSWPSPSLDVDTLRALQAPAEKELTWIREHGKPRYPFRRQYREAFHYMKQDPVVHAESLERYLGVAPHLIPTSPELNFPVLRHPDIQPNNMFISEDYRVTSLIDWQHATALPTFLAAGIPNSFQNYGDAESRSFTPPRPPINLDSLGELECAQVQEEFRRRHVHFSYLGFTQRFNQQHWRALEEEADFLRRRIFDHAGEPWEGVNTALQYDLV